MEELNGEPPVGLARCAICQAGACPFAGRGGVKCHNFSIINI